jgi:hypothetical protein
VQAAVPFTDLYFPTAHKEHTPPFGPVAPTLHTHDPIIPLPAPETAFAGQFRHAPVPVAPTVAEYVLAAQSKQVSFPVVFLYFPATHSTHEPPFCPLLPAVHIHAVMEELDDCEIEFTGQEEQTVAPATTENVFTGH